MKDVVLDNLVLTAVPTAVVDVIWNDVSRVLRRSVLTAGGRFELNDVREGINILSVSHWLWIGSEVLECVNGYLRLKRS